MQNQMKALVKAKPEPGLWMEYVPVPEVGPTDVPVVVYCHSGRRSATAGEMLEDAGYVEVYDLGPMSAW